MAKSSIGQINTTQTFQNWLDKTNDIVDLLETDVMTASALGDTTTGNATLVGTFTANTVIGFDNVKTDELASKTLAGTIGATSPISVSSSGTHSIVIDDDTGIATGPRISYSSGGVTWDTGFNSIGNDPDDYYFTINTGIGIPKLTLSPTGDLVIAGKIEAPGGLVGDVYASDGTTKILENGNGTTTNAIFVGDHVGDVFNSDGSKVVEAGSNTVEAQFKGNLLGDVYAIKASDPTTAIRVLDSGDVDNIKASFRGDVIGDIRAENSTVVLDSGTDGTDAVFAGTAAGLITPRRVSFDGFLSGFFDFDGTSNVTVPTALGANRYRTITTNIATNIPIPNSGPVDSTPFVVNVENDSIISVFWSAFPDTSGVITSTRTFGAHVYVDGDINNRPGYGASYTATNFVPPPLSNHFAVAREAGSTFTINLRYWGADYFTTGPVGIGFVGATLLIQVLDLGPYGSVVPFTPT